MNHWKKTKGIDRYRHKNSLRESIAVIGGQFDDNLAAVGRLATRKRDKYLQRFKDVKKPISDTAKARIKKDRARELAEKLRRKRMGL